MLLEPARREGHRFLNPVPTGVGNLSVIFKVLPRLLFEGHARVPEWPLGPFPTEATSYLARWAELYYGRNHATLHHDFHPYDVAATSYVNEALSLAAGKDAALAAAVLVHGRQGDPSGRLVHHLLEADLHIPILLVDRAGDLAPVRYADNRFAWSTCKPPYSLRHR